MSGIAEPSTKLRAWTIDDSEFDLKPNHRILSRSGAFAEIQAFSSAQHVLEALRKVRTPPHVIFLDIMMPIKTGFDFLIEATQEHGDAFASRVVIMLTSSFDPVDPGRADGFRAVKGFLSKPLTTEDSHRVAAKAVDIVSATRPNERCAVPD